MVEIKEKWIEVYFTASKKGLEPVTIELSLNKQQGSYTLRTEHEEGVRFDDNDIEISKLKVQAVNAALKYVEQVLKVKNKKT